MRAAPMCGTLAVVYRVFLGESPIMSVSPQSLEAGAPVAPTVGVMAKAASGAKFALFVLFAINLLNFFD